MDKNDNEAISINTFLIKTKRKFIGRILINSDRLPENYRDLDIFVSGFSTLVTVEHLVPVAQYMINKIFIKSNVRDHNLIIIARYSFVFYGIDKM